MDMKKFYIPMMLMAVAAIASCEKQPVAIEEPEAGNGTYVYTIKASVPETKSDYDANGHFTWSSGDAISVLFHNGDVNKFFVLETTETGASVSFSGAVEDGYEIGASDGTSEDKKIWALFPASGSHEYTAGSNPTFYVRPSVDFAATYFSANIPMCALNAAEGDLSFENIASTYKFTVSGVKDGISKVRFTVYNQTTYGLSGSWPISGTSDKYINYNWASPGSANSTLSYVGNVVNNEAVFYVSCRYWGDFQPSISVINEATGIAIKSFDAAKSLRPTSKTSVKPITLDVSDGDYYAPAIDIDGVFNDWDGITEYDGTRASGSSNSRINHWRVTSDALNIYVYLELNSEKITEARYIYVGFNTDNDTNTGTARGSIPGCEQYAVIYPAVAGSDPLEMIQGADPRSTVNGSSDGSLRTWCVLGNPSSQLELCIPRSKVGLSSAGTIKVGVSYDNYDAKEQSLTLN